MNARKFDLLVATNRIARMFDQGFALDDEIAEKLPTLRALQAWWTAVAITKIEEGEVMAYDMPLGWEVDDEGPELEFVFRKELVLVKADWDRLEIYFLRTLDGLEEHRIPLDFHLRVNNTGDVFFGWPIPETANLAHIELLWKFDKEVFDGRIRQNLEDAYAHRDNVVYTNVEVAVRLLEPKNLAIS